MKLPEEKPIAEAPANGMVQQMTAALLEACHGRVVSSGAGSLPSIFAVSDLAAAAVGTAGLALHQLLDADGGGQDPVLIDRRLASMWFAWSLRPQGWSPPPPWDPIAGDYRTSDGWIRLHTNAPRHRAAALGVLNVDAEREAVAEVVAQWRGRDLEGQIVEAGGCAAEMRSQVQWLESTPGSSVSAEPLIAWDIIGEKKSSPQRWDRAKPLRGVRVLDLTRVLAGPVATRFLASIGADVLRVDPPDWDEPGVVPEVMPGKRSVRLDLKKEFDRRRFIDLLAGCDMLVHGYRPGALDEIGFGQTERSSINPSMIDITLNAYGWTSPWSGRRGFDSLVQMSCGIAEAGMRLLGKDRPTPLPVQALDHATGYLMAAAAISALSHRARTGNAMRARLSLARTAALLMAHTNDDPSTLAPEEPGDRDGWIEPTFWGPASRLKSPISLAEVDFRPTIPAAPLGTHQPSWQ